MSDITYLIHLVSPATQFGPNGTGDYKTGNLAIDYSRIEHRAGPPLPTLVELQAKHTQLEAGKLTPDWDVIRERRNHLLDDSDWTQLLDAPIDAATQAKWAAYRQSLRDIPQAHSTPGGVVWPTPPK